MCIIAYKPGNVDIPENNLRNMWFSNPHGAGFMFPKDHRVVMNKGFMTYDSFISAYREVKNEQLVMHFRWKTHGAVSPKLTHPFWVIPKGVAMVHNGVIRSILSEVTEGESDTSTYARRLGRRYTDPMLALQDKFEASRIISEIGYSKLVFMDGEGNVKIVNERMGHWYNGCWYSNHTYTNYYGYESKFEKYDYDYTKWLPSSHVSSR